jgi:hypothetical protein
MRHRLVSVILACAAAILIALASVGSAAMMAPDRDQIALEASALLFGSDHSDLCGDPGTDEQHQCPFCLLLGDPPALAPIDRTSVLRPHELWRRLAELHREAQARDPSHGSRAPPFQA